MPIPDLDSIHLPLLKAIGDGKKHNIREVTEILAAHFSVTPEERQQFTEIGRKRTFDTRVSWAVSQLRHSGLLENTERGIFKITERGRDALKLNPDRSLKPLLRTSTIQKMEEIEWLTNTCRLTY